MTSWLPVVLGALAASLIAWGAIAVFAWLGRLGLDARPLRGFGAAALGLLAGAVAGLPVPWVLPPLLLAVGVGLAIGLPRVDGVGG